MTDRTTDKPDTAPSMPNAAPSEKPKADERLGVITGVRVCAKCGFNLMGQLTLREPIYGLIVARCPECGQVAPLQEYPSMGRTAKRWSTLLGSLWVLVVLGVGTGVSFALMGLMFGSVEIGSDDFATMLPGSYWSTTVDRAAHQELLTDLGGPIAAIDPWVLGIWFGGAVLAVIAGIASSVLMLGVRGVRLALLPLVLLAVPIVGYGIRRAVVLAEISAGSTSKSEVAEWLLGPTISAITLAIFGVMIMGGATFGRALVRGLVRVLLPAPMRAGLAPLWLTDGKKLPRGRGW
ncbi:MAG: hypothetical protein KDA20_05070 [Phycisphaerales bacterium]|nr:hypothetical protein [Phycisphaerales bacterium]